MKIRNVSSTDLESYSWAEAWEEAKEYKPASTHRWKLWKYKLDERFNYSHLVGLRYAYKKGGRKLAQKYVEILKWLQTFDQYGNDGFRTDYYGVYGPRPEDLVDLCYAAGSSFGAIRILKECIEDHQGLLTWKGRFDEEIFLPRTRRQYRCWRWLQKIFASPDWSLATLRVWQKLAKLSPRARWIARAVIRKRYEDCIYKTNSLDFWKEVQKALQNWKPLAKYLPKGFIWKELFGRVPQNENIKRLPRDVIFALSKGNRFKLFLRAVRELKTQEDLTEHGCLALAKFICVFGSAWKSVLPPMGPADRIHVIHDLGIDLPVEVTYDQRLFLLRYRHRLDNALRVVKNWDFVLQEGVNPLGKGGLRCALEVIKANQYEGIQHKGFAAECAKWGISQNHFEKYQERWLATLKHLKYQSIPRIDFIEGDWRCYVLSKDDPRGIFLGEYTGCCQHPDGAGAVCAWHGHESPDGAFFVWEYRGQIYLQSWLWRQGDALVFDNIEGRLPSGVSSEEIVELVIKAARQFLGKLGIRRIYIGTGHSDVELTLPKIYLSQAGLSAPTSYSDANTVWVVSE